MSYTKHTWSGEESITNAKMNNIEGGIEEAMQSGGGSDVVLIYYPNSEVGFQTTGDFATCLAKLQQGIPFIAYDCAYNSYSGGFNVYISNPLTVNYDTEYPNRINLMITGGIGYLWTENGIEYYD